MAVNFGTSGAQYYDTPDKVLFTIPNDNWGFIVIFNINVTNASNGILWQNANTGGLSIFKNTSNQFAAFLGAGVNVTGALVVGTWYVGYVRRLGGLLKCGRCNMGKPGSLAESGTQTLSSSNNGAGCRIGARLDAASPFFGRISHIAYFPYTKIEAAYIQYIAEGARIEDLPIYDNRLWHAKLTTRSKYVLSNFHGKGTYVFTRNGSSFGIDESEYPQLKLKEKMNFAAFKPVANNLPVFHNHYVNQGWV